METVGVILLSLGIILVVIGGLQLLFLTFQEHLLWGLAFLLLPLIGLIFVALHWQKSRVPFFTYLAGFILFAVGVWLSDTGEEVLEYLPPGLF